MPVILRVFSIVFNPFCKARIRSCLLESKGLCPGGLVSRFFGLCSALRFWPSSWLGPEEAGRLSLLRIRGYGGTIFKTRLEEAVKGISRGRLSLQDKCHSNKNYLFCHAPTQSTNQNA